MNVSPISLTQPNFSSFRSFLTAPKSWKDGVLGITLVGAGGFGIRKLLFSDSNISTNEFLLKAIGSPLMLLVGGLFIGMYINHLLHRSAGKPKS